MSRCVWLTRDDTGRPSCEHGAAFKSGDRWRCRLKHYANMRKYDRSEKGRETKRRDNASSAAQSRKALYEVTRIRVS